MVSHTRRRRVRRLRGRGRDAQGVAKYTNQVPFGPDGALQSPGVYVAMGLGDELLARAAEVGHVAGVTSRLMPALRRGRDAIPPWTAALQNAVMVENRDADLQTIRGWLALESGNIETARDELTAVTKRAAAPNSLIRGYRSPRPPTSCSWNGSRRLPSFVVLIGPRRTHHTGAWPSCRRSRPIWPAWTSSCAAHQKRTSRLVFARECGGLIGSFSVAGSQAGHFVEHAADMDAVEDRLGSWRRTGNAAGVRLGF